MKTPFIELPVATADGVFVAYYSENGLAEIDWPEKKKREAKSEKRKLNADVSLAIIKNWHKLTTDALGKILAGKPAGKLPPLDWSGKTEFQKSVWREMLKIPAGKTKSYGEVAAVIGKPKAVRAVGGACGANPIPVLVPCHRILAANKNIGGFTGGLERKRELLAREGIKF
jgi:O-6-methylguanine DNA methyltransferase